MALTIGPGFLDWNAQHKATPKSNERYCSSEMSVILVETSNAAGDKVNELLLYNKLTNEIVPFVQAT
jgi:hypothetical protein